MQVQEFDYVLPEELIAQHPIERRDASRLMVVNPVDKSILHQRFHDLPQFLKPGDVLVFNDSKVIPARLYGVKDGTGAGIELLLTQPVNETRWWALAKPAKRLKVGSIVRFTRAEGEQPAEDAPYAVVTEAGEDGLRCFQFELSGTMDQFLDAYGTMPLPPYIHARLQDRDRYQTVYAKEAGSVAAPTAGLHFTDDLLQTLRQQGVELAYVTLHVGLGTFRPVSADQVEDHVMHVESYFVPHAEAERINRAMAEGRRIVAVGTTALRTLESAVADGRLQAGHGETGIFIFPGYQFQVVDALITNFHLPKSTLIMLVSALMGTEFTKTVYQEAVQERYRFFSFGDAMMIQARGGEASAASHV